MNQDFVMHNNNNQEFETLIRSQPNGSEENWQLLMQMLLEQTL